MIRFLILFLVTFPFLGANASEKGVNIYAIPREPTSKVMYAESGKKIKFSDFENDFVLAVFWSRHCFPCIKEMKSLQNFAKKTKNNGVRVILISPKKEWPGGFSEQRRFLKKFGGEEMETYVDYRGEMASAMGIFSSPLVVLISREGKEIGRIRGSAEWDRPEVIEYIYKIKAEHG